MNNPIIIPCEGSGHPTHQLDGPMLLRSLRSLGEGGDSLGMCKMCGMVFNVDSDGNAPQHTRQDILAMIERGDFDS